MTVLGWPHHRLSITSPPHLDLYYAISADRHLHAPCAAARYRWVYAPTWTGFGSRPLKRVLNSQIGAHSANSHNPEKPRAHIEVRLLVFELVQPSATAVLSAPNEPRLLAL